MNLSAEERKAQAIQQQNDRLLAAAERKAEHARLQALAGSGGFDLTHSVIFRFLSASDSDVLIKYMAGSPNFGQWVITSQRSGIDGSGYEIPESEIRFLWDCGLLERLKVETLVVDSSLVEEIRWCVAVNEPNAEDVSSPALNLLRRFVIGLEGDEGV